MSCDPAPAKPVAHKVCGDNCLSNPLDQVAATTCNAYTFSPSGPCTSTGALDVPKTTAPVGGTCAPSTQTPTLPVEWAEEVRACSAAGVAQGKCTTGQVCAWSAEASHKLCVWQKGDTTCPASPSVYAEKHVYYGGIDDTRTCSACACGAAAAGSCGAVGVYAPGACTSLVIEAPSGTCTAFPAAVPTGTEIPLLWLPDRVTGRACAASGGAPSGSAAPADPTTFCCIP